MKSKSTLLGSLMRAFRLSIYSNQKNTPPVDELADILKEKGTSRREFLNRSGLLIGASLLNTSCYGANIEPIQSIKLNTGAKKSADKKIAIIGAGVAGLNAAYKLKKAGISSIIYEAAGRVGGRMQTARNVFGAGITTEIGGEFIDSGHTEMLALAQEFNLELIDTDLDTLKKQLFYIQDQTYSLSEVIVEFKKVAPKILADQNKLNDNLTNNASITFDNLTLKQYLQSLNTTNWLTALLDAAYVAEFGQATEHQSTLNFLTLIGTETNTSDFDVFGESDERYKIKGGNDLITKNLAERLEGQIEMNEQLVSIKQFAKEYILTFKSGKTIKADYVVLAIPFTILRNIQLELKELSAKKRACIQDYGYGNNSKLIMGFNQKIWREEGYQGYMFNEKVSDGWDSSQLQANTGASYTIYTGGQAAIDMANNFNNKQVEIDKYLPIMERAFGNRTGQFNGKSMIANWPTNPYVLASYGCFKPGQYTKFYALAGEAAGNVFFAGEHCSQDFQGFMEGGAETGKSAAEAILKKVKI